MATQAERICTPEMTDAQREEFAILMGQLATAQSEYNAAEKALGLARANAERFVGFCARENRVPLGQDKWRFDQFQLRFTQEPVHMNGNGKEG